jgi:hypothetical protein
MIQSNNNQGKVDKYYVYGHYTPDTDVLFYIGVGTILNKSQKETQRYSRAYHFSNRNKYWNNVKQKHGVVVKILSHFSSKEDSLKEEAFLVEKFGRRIMNQGTLVNISSGGEVGPVGRIVVISENQRRIISERKAIILYVYNSLGEYIKPIKTIKETAKFCGVTYNAIHSCMKTKNYSNGYFIFKEYKGEKLGYTVENLNFKSTLSIRLSTTDAAGNRLEHDSIQDCATYLKTDRSNLKKAIREKRLCKKHKVKFIL